MMGSIKSVTVIGASAGGYSAIAELISLIPADIETAIFVVMHMSPRSLGQVLVDHIQKKTSYKCSLAVDNVLIHQGHVYVAPPDYHLVVKKGIMKVIKGTHENRWRPSIDVLFRSAAAAYDSHVIGIVLSGLLDDGTSGMAAIKRSGGKCIVQEPAEAEFPDMPKNVLNNVDVDHRVPVADMGYIIQDILSEPYDYTIREIPEDIKIETTITERRITSMDELEKIGTRSNYSCPDCGGAMWEIKDDVITRFRCYTGHVYTGGLLLDKQSEALEESLWISIRMLEERRALLKTMALREQGGSSDQSEPNKSEKAEEPTQHIERLKMLLASMNRTSAQSGSYE